MKRRSMTPSVIASLMLIADTAVVAGPVSVSGGTVHFEGELANVACTVSTRSSDQVVTLGQCRTASFTAADDTTAQTPFSIVLNDCDPEIVTAAAVALSGQSDITNSNLLAVTSTDNGAVANGVGIEILDDTSTVLKSDGATFSTIQALVEGTNTLRFSARYKATTTSAMPGQANADATFIMRYE